MWWMLALAAVVGEMYTAVKLAYYGELWGRARGGEPTAWMAAAAALPAHHKNGLLEKKAILPAIFAGLAAAGLAAWISTGLDTRLLRKLFGLFLLYVGITQLVQRDDR